MGGLGWGGSVGFPARNKNQLKFELIKYDSLLDLLHGMLDQRFMSQ